MEADLVVVPWRTPGLSLEVIRRKVITVSMEGMGRSGSLCLKYNRGAYERLKQERRTMAGATCSWCVAITHQMLSEIKFLGVTLGILEVLSH